MIATQKLGTKFEIYFQNSYVNWPKFIVLAGPMGGSDSLRRVKNKLIIFFNAIILFNGR